MPTGVYKRTPDMKTGKYKCPWTEERKMERRKIAKQKGFGKWMKFKIGENANNYKGGIYKYHNYKGIHGRVYRQIHKLISKKLGKPSTCKNCKKKGLSGHKIHWANISGEYSIDTSDWIRLCAKCHALFDKDRESIELLLNV